MLFNIIILVFLVILATHLFIFGFKSVLLWRKNFRLLNCFPNNIQSLSCHTYKPKNGIVPLRGRIVADCAYQRAEKLKVPLILSVGHTVKGENRTEGEIYRDYLYQKYGQQVPIIVGQNSLVRDSYGEIQETYKIIQQLHFQYHGVIALLPHLVLRLIPYWQQVNQDKQPQVYFEGIWGPIRYFFWEFIMMILEFYLPPNSKQRKFILNLVKRKK